MKKRDYIRAAAVVYLVLTLANAGSSQSISDVVKKERKRQGDAKTQGKAYTNEDLERFKQVGSVSTAKLPSEEKGMVAKESEEAEAESKGKENRKDSSAWLSGAQGYEQAMQERRRTGKPLVLYFYTDWCGYCRRFNSSILTSYEFQAYMRNVIAVRINPESGGNESAIASKYGITGYPSFFILPTGSEQALRVHPFSRQDGKWVAMTPSTFVQACKAAGG